MDTAFDLKVDENGVARLTFDLPGEKVNTFSSATMRELETHLKKLAIRKDIKALFLLSGKPGIFIAGADIDELARINNEQEALAKARRGQALFGKIAALPFPSIAVIDGACVGGGLECALACDYRVVSDNPKTKLGLPEVSLGIIPGWGGSQRLPQLIGLSKALGLILAGSAVGGKKAMQLGLADKLVAHEFLDESVSEFLDEVLNNPRAILGKRNAKGFTRWFLDKTPIGHYLVFRKARQSLLHRTKGKYPAPEEALNVVRETIGCSLESGLIFEARAFSKLCVTHVSKNLVQLFYSNEALKKDAGIGKSLHPTPVKSAGILGAGVMGGGIAWLLSSKDISVRMKDIDWGAITVGLAEANTYYNQLIKRRKINKGTVNVKMHHISGTVDYSGFRNVDIVIEAVVENLDVKRKVLREVELQIRDDAVIASNTSSLSIDDIAVALERPERFVGMHFFNPVNRMPLVEVVAGKKTSQEAIAKIVSLTRRLGKTPIVVNNCSGFLVNRILIPYLNESAHMLEEGTSMMRIDAAIEAFGMPMGPFALADEVGIDVGVKVATILENAYGNRMRVADIMKMLYEEQHLVGKKQGKGFYIHKGKCRTPNEKDIESITRKMEMRMQNPSTSLNNEEIVNRAMLTMINEASRCLEEDIVHDPEHLDMAMIMGTGFPAFRGGLLRYADERGLSAVCCSLGKMSEVYGKRFEPSPLLLEMERKGERFYASS